jgi:mono/diheme cytochrome c family protein
VRTIAWALPAALLALYACGRALAQNPQGSAVTRGDDLARLVCSTCHVVAADQDFPPALQPPAPSFLDIANRPGTTAKSLRQFILITHWDLKSTRVTMPNPRMRPEDASALADYIMSLRKASPREAH